jgi:tetratricopeptide (TPR) repeat protein
LLKESGVRSVFFVVLRGSLALNKRKILEAARKFAQKGANAKALKEYNKLLSADARDAKLLLEVGDAYRRWGQIEEAIAQYAKVAQQYGQDGFDARAVAVFKQILNLDPKNYGAYVSLSDLYQRMGLDSEAVGALQTAADGYHKEGRKPEALELLRQRAALDPTNTTSRLKVAELLRQEGMEPEAIEEYEAVIGELDNHDDREQLVTVYERILEVRPDQLTALTGLVRQLIAGHDFERAEPLATRALNISTDTPQYDLLMDIYTQTGDEGKLADATRGMAKLYRERGDDEKARELMQRLPVERGSSSSCLAVNVSEFTEPELEHEDLLGAEDEVFFSHDDADDLESQPAGGLALAPGEAVNGPAFELGSDPAQEPSERTLELEEPLPEGDPDQLFAEASVYLRYGKRDQAIASLRGILAQQPNHPAALEKLGEAYADDEQSAEAVRVWLQAAEQIRSCGDAPALEILRHRILALDPAMAEQVGQVSATVAAQLTPKPVPAPVIELDLDLDLDVELDLDRAIDEIESSESQTGLRFDPDLSESDDSGAADFVIDLDEESVTFDSPLLAEEPNPNAELVLEETIADFDLSFENDDESEIEFEIDDDELSFGNPPQTIEKQEADGSLIQFDLDSTELPECRADGLAGQSSKTAAQIREEIEEAEFYIAQEMYDEAEGVLQRILEIFPSHPAALLRMGEVVSARGEAQDSATGTAAAVAASVYDFESKVPFTNTEPYELDLQEARDSEAESALDDRDAFEVELDLDDYGAPELTLDDEKEEDALEISESPVKAEATTQEDPISAEAADEVTPEAEPVDPAETFDLREALADVLTEEAAQTPNPKEESGVLSTVEDGFESIFADFKKGVTATLEDGDFDTRYDLGIAYREMGLYEDAIGEFRVCLDSSTRRFDSLYLMGLCARDLQRFPDAINHLKQALAMPDLPEERMAGVYFDLSEAELSGGDHARACASLRRVIELEPGFPGASERLTALEAGEARAPGLANDGFESFDDLFVDDDADEWGDSEIVEAASLETFESFEDIVGETESALAAALIKEEPRNIAGPRTRKKRGRKRISFV